MKPLYIFDLDGTLANIEHRRPLLEMNSDNKWNWFYAMCIHDTPIEAVTRTLNFLQDQGCDIWVWSGRSEAVRPETENWLYVNTMLLAHNDNGARGSFDYNLSMRAINDFTKDGDLKQRWLNNMLQVDRERLVAVFDDRQQVVDMWRKNGIVCFQTAPGNF